MALLDQIIGGLMSGSSSGGGSPLQNVLTSLLAGAGNQPGGAAGQPGAQGTGAPAMGGGLGGLISMFQQAGLGQVAQSWIGNGPNQPVTPNQLNSVFGEQQVQSMANQAGMAPDDFLSQLSHHLPRVVDGVTPNGTLPDEGTVSV